MTILQNRVLQLSTIIHAWNELEESSQKNSINFISEFIESASLLQKLSGDTLLESELTIFNKNNKKQLNIDLLWMKFLIGATMSKKGKKNF